MELLKMLKKVLIIYRLNYYKKQLQKYTKEYDEINKSHFITL